MIHIQSCQSATHDMKAMYKPHRSCTRQLKTRFYEKKIQAELFSVFVGNVRVLPVSLGRFNATSPSAS